MKLCINCKWLDDGRYCTRWRWINPVDGTEEHAPIVARIERDVTQPVRCCTTPDPCGAEGKHWTEAPQKPTPSVKLPWWRRLFSPANQTDQQHAP